MGTEEEAKQEQAAHPKPEEKMAAAAAEEKKEEKAAAAIEEDTKEDQEKKNNEEEEEPPKPPSPCILHVDLHCVGCAKKIEKCILKIRGVEGVVMDMAQNQVTIKGIVDPQAVCSLITNKTKRKPQILSPVLPPPADQAQQIVSSQVSVATTVELNVNMHCEACAEQLKKKILKMRGVQSVTTELGTEKVRVTGTMDPDKLVEYVYRRTKKQARIVPQPEPEPKPEPEKLKEGEKPADPEAGEEKKKEDEEENKEGSELGGETEQEKGGDDDDDESGDDVMMILRSDEEEEEDNMKKRMMYNYFNNYQQPLYVIDKMPPAPQLFSDENPNACCIS